MGFRDFAGSVQLYSESLVNQTREYRKMRILFCAISIVFIGVLLPQNASASDQIQAIPDTVLVYKDDSGELQSGARQAVAHLKDAANVNGFVELWIYLNPSRFSGTNSPSERQYKSACRKLLKRLVTAGHVWHPTAGIQNSGPVCFVRASARAVDVLSVDDRVEQILGTTHAH